jgi:capsid protein
VSAGLEIFGDPDEKLSAFSPGIPSPEFFPHTMLLLTFIAINLDLPVQVLLLDPSRTNFSSWRGAIDQARLRFRQIQSWMVEKFHRPVYQWWLTRLIAYSPELAAAAKAEGVDAFSHRWNPPTFPYIEPLTDAQADQLQIEQALNSRRRIQAARGRDWDEVREEIIADNASLIRAAIVASLELKAEFPNVSVDWREIVCVPVADNVSATLPPAGQASNTPRPTPATMDDSPDGPEEPGSFGGRLGFLNGAGKH